MRFVASAALVISMVLMVLCRVFETTMPWLAWPRAFFEAATVGAMADWFAVVALFRRPMGLPIPHTAILPNNKARVAESLAMFLETTFLTEEQLGPKFRGLDYAGFASKWLGENATMLADKAARFAPDIVEGLSDDEMSALLADRAGALIRQAEVGPMLGEGVEVLVQNGRDREIFVAVLTSVRQLVEEHRGVIQSKISQEIPISGDMLSGIPFGKPLVGPLLDQVRDTIASAVAGKTIEKVQATLDEASRESDNPLWISFDQRLRKFIADLKSSPEMAQKISGMQQTLADSAVVRDFADKTWREIKVFILRDCASGDSIVRRKIEETIRSASRQLAENPGARAEINTFLGEQVLVGILAARPHARELVLSTMTGWDSTEMAEKLEGAVGRDLQFIRLNGTLVGGLIGLTIHGLFWVFGK